MSRLLSEFRRWGANLLAKVKAKPVDTAVFAGLFLFGAIILYSRGMAIPDAPEPPAVETTDSATENS